MTKPTHVLAITSSLMVLAVGCTVEDGGLDAAELDDETAEEGAETLDDGALDDEDDEFRAYEGVIGNPWSGNQVRTGTTVGKIHEFSPTCASSNNASDVSYTWTAPSTASFTFTTAGSSYDTILHIRPFTNSAQTLGCNDDANGTLQSSVTLNITQGTTVIIVVDGYSNYSGNFKLNISKTNPCPGGCSSPPTQCHASPGVCLIDPMVGSGSCNYPPQLAGTVCEDNNWCSTGSSCINYSCVPDTFRTCNTPPNDCYEAVGTCDWTTQSCTYTTPKPAGTACNDGLPCTKFDACDGDGGCVGSVGLCSAGETCTASGCVSFSCAQYGNFEHCGLDDCCVWGSNCTICI